MEPRVLSQSSVQLSSSGSQTPPRRDWRDSWRAIIIQETNMSWSVPDVPCLPSNVPTADTKAAVFTILVIFHYITPLHHPRNSIVVFPHSGLRRWMRHVRRESDRCLVLRSHRSQGYSRQGFSDISHRTLEIVEETEDYRLYDLCFASTQTLNFRRVSCYIED